MRPPDDEPTSDGDMPDHSIRYQQVPIQREVWASLGDLVERYGRDPALLATHHTRRGLRWTVGRQASVERSGWRVWLSPWY